MTFLTKMHVLPDLMAGGQARGGERRGRLPLSEGDQQMLTCHSHLDSVFHVCVAGAAVHYIEDG